MSPAAATGALAAGAEVAAFEAGADFDSPPPQPVRAIAPTNSARRGSFFIVEISFLSREMSTQYMPRRVRKGPGSRASHAGCRACTQIVEPEGPAYLAAGESRTGGRPRHWNRGLSEKTR